MGIVLGILGILGKILLWLLGIFCVLVLLLLFYPIKYQVEGEWRDGARVQGRLQWFWFLVRIYFSYEEEFQWKIRLLGFDLMKIMEGNPGGRGKKRRKKPAGTGEGRSNHQQMSTGHAGAGETSTPKEPPRVQNVQYRPGRQNPFKKWWRKVRQFMKWCKRFVENLRRKAGFAKEMTSLLREDNSRELVCILKDNVLHLWRKLKPKVFRGHLLFGTGDPASTGEILGFFAILYAWYGDRVRIVPDFEQKIWEGDFFVRGGISIFPFLLVYFRVFRSDEWRCFKREYDRLATAIHGEF